MIRELWRTLAELSGSRQGRHLIFGLVWIFALGTVFYRLAEGWSWLDALYFTVVTLATVGFGDLTPTTAVSKVGTIILILGGVGYILAFLNFLVTRTLKRRNIEPEK